MTASPHRLSAQDKPMSRAGCWLWALLWLIVMALPLLALLLAVKGELTWRRGEFVEDRLWLVNEAGAAGLGYSTARIVSDERPADGPICIRTQVHFFLWKGTGDGVRFCDCYVRVEGGGYAASGECP